MKALRMFLPFFARLRIPAACLFGCAAVVMLWSGLGLSGLLPLPGPAQAGAEHQDMQGAPLSVISKERASLLQSTVDGVALGLGGALAASDSGASRQEALSRALSALTFKLGGEVYFTAWQDTRILHSPMNPDAEDMDFADTLDEQGAPFVREMMRAAASGGGFLRVTLPRQLPGQTAPLLLNPDDAAVTRDLDALTGSLAQGGAASGQGPAARGTINPVRISAAGVAVDDSGTDIFCPSPQLCPLNNDASPACLPGPGRHAPVQDSTPVEQAVYVRGIPGSPWHIAAFMPADPGPWRADERFSAAWDEQAASSAEDNFRTGLCMSGFSLAGLAGLLLAPVRRREDDEDSGADIL